MITKPQNVYVMRDVMCSGYVAGGNTRFFGLPQGATTFVNPATPQDVVRTLNERLSFADDSSGEYASMLAFAAPYDDEANSSRDQVISISDRLLPWEVAKNADPAKKYFPGGQRGYDAYNRTWNLGQIHFGEDVRATENMAFMSQGAVNNSLAVIGPHRKYNPFAQNFFELVPGQGHFVRRPPSRIRCPRSHSSAHRAFVLRAGPGRDPRRCEVEAGRERVAQDRTRLDGLARGGGALAAGVPQGERHLSVRRGGARSLPGSRRVAAQALRAVHSGTPMTDPRKRA